MKTLVLLPVFDTHVLERVLKLDSELNDPVPLTDEQVRSDIQEYLEFLRWHKMNPGKDCLPEVRVDRVWHIHMIQTRDYAAVCESYLGTFLHHASMICGAGQERTYPWHYRGDREEKAALVA
jgi:hypothetical protein